MAIELPPNRTDLEKRLWQALVPSKLPKNNILAASDLAGDRQVFRLAPHAPSSETANTWWSHRGTIGALKQSIEWHWTGVYEVVDQATGVYLTLDNVPTLEKLDRLKAAVQANLGVAQQLHGMRQTTAPQALKLSDGVGAHLNHAPFWWVRGIPIYFTDEQKNKSQLHLHQKQQTQKIWSQHARRPMTQGVGRLHRQRCDKTRINQPTGRLNLWVNQSFELNHRALDTNKLRGFKRQIQPGVKATIQPFTHLGRRWSQSTKRPDGKIKTRLVRQKHGVCASNPASYTRRDVAKKLTLSRDYIGLAAPPPVQNTTTTTAYTTSDNINKQTKNWRTQTKKGKNSCQH